MGNQALSSSITKKYAVDPTTPVASVGPLGLWSVWQARVKDRGSPQASSGAEGDQGSAVSLWVLRKADASKIDHQNITRLKPKEQARAVLAHLTAGAKQLSLLRHPNLLRIIEVLPDTGNHIAVVTEPIFASLANALKRYNGPAFTTAESSPGPASGTRPDVSTAADPPAVLREFSMSEFEICHGMHQIAEALRFLHEEAKTVHGNVCPSSIVLTTSGDWKLCGLGFSQQGIGEGDFAKATMFTQDACEEDNAATRQTAPPRVPLRPAINYAAPEICDASITRRECSHGSDVFSFACLLWELTVGMQAQKDGTAQLLLQGRDGRVSTHRYKLSQLNPDQVVMSAGMPDSLRETLRAMLQVDPRRRPSMRQVCSSPYFDSGSVKVLKIVASLTENDTTIARQAQILAHLPKQLNQFPARILRDRVLPTLVTMCAARSQTTPFVLPSLLFIARKLSRGEFDRTLAPVFRALVNDLSKMAAQCTLILVENVQILLDQGSRLFTQDVILPMVIGALRGGNNIGQYSDASASSRGQYYSYEGVKSNNNQLQKFTAPDVSRIRLAALAKIDAVADASPGHTFQKTIFPTVAALLLDQQDTNVVVAALDAVRASFRRLNSDMIVALVLPAVEACIKKQFQNGELCVHVAKTYEALAIHLGAKWSAQKILPVVVRLLAEKHFTDDQFAQYVDSILGIVERIKTVRLRGGVNGANFGAIPDGVPPASIIVDGRGMPNLDFAVAAAAQVAAASIDDSAQSASFVKKEITMPPRRKQPTLRNMAKVTMGSAGRDYAIMDDEDSGGSGMGDLLSLDMTPAPGSMQCRPTINTMAPFLSASGERGGGGGQWSSMGAPIPVDLLEPQQQQDQQNRTGQINSMVSSGGARHPSEELLPSMGGLHMSRQGSDYGSLSDGLPGNDVYAELGNINVGPMGSAGGGSGSGSYLAPVIPGIGGVQQHSQRQQPLFLGLSGTPQQQEKLQIQKNNLGRSSTNSSTENLDIFAGLSGIPTKQSQQQQKQQTKPRASTSSSVSGFDFI